MKGIVTGFKDGYPIVLTEEYKRIVADFAHGDVFEKGDRVEIQDVSSLPEDPDHYIITHEDGHKL